MWSWDKKCDVSELSSAFIRSDVYIISDTKKQGETSSHAQNIVTTSVLSSGELLRALGRYLLLTSCSGWEPLGPVPQTTDHRVGGGFCVKCLASPSDYYTPPEFSSFSWPVNRWQLRNNRLVTNDGNNIKRETQAGREPSEWGLYLWNEELCSVDFLSYKPDPLEKLEP